MQLNDKILFLRKREGLSQEELANEMDVSRQTVYKWETGDIFPEMAKLKKLAKFFNVSFDYLMDDNIDELEPAQPTKKQIIDRKVFSTQIATDYNQADIDNGFVESRKCKVKYENYLKDNQNKITKALKEIGATTVFFIQPNGATAFFYDKVKKVCGFYYAGQIQFLCPIEKLVDCYASQDKDININTRKLIGGVGVGLNGINSIGVGSMPSVNTIPSTQAYFYVLYKAKDEVKKFELTFSVNNLYMVYNQKNPDTEEFQIWQGLYMEGLVKNLQKLEHDIKALISIASNNIQAGEDFEEIDYEFYKKQNAKTKAQYLEYLGAITEEAKRENRADTIKFILLVGMLVAIGIFILSIILR